jgi:cytochrome P450
VTGEEHTVTETFSETPAAARFPMPRAAGCPFDPPPALHDLLAEQPISRVRVWDGSTPWLITRYADQRALLTDPRVSADQARPGYPHQSENLRARRDGTISFVTMDDPEHARLRRMVIAPFTVRRMEALRPSVQRIVDDLIDGLLAGPKPADLVAELALPVPSLVICALLGVPYTDHEFFQRTSKLLLSATAPVDTVVAAQADLMAYLDDLVGRKLEDPTDDLLSSVGVKQVRTGQLTRQQLARMGMLLLVAGHETTANMISLGTAALLEHPDQFAALRDADDPAVIRGAVEELLRYLTITHSGRRRVALADIEIDGHVIRAGDGMVLAHNVGNRDEDVFADPDRLDVHRDARKHLAFGFGVHQCLGQPLARMELQVVYGTLYRRIPTMRLATPLADVPFRHDGLIYGIEELPITW